MPPIAGVPVRDRDAILATRRDRARLLEKEIAPRIREFLKAPKDLRELKALLGGNYQRMLDSAKDRVRASGGERYGLSDPEIVSLHAYTGSWYVQLNGSLRGERGQAEL